ncbi:MAG: hypothetical protein JNK48_05145, partial [Bryobacterales bacterium]|nr:hypothetical protein [Bryobacterales bacterium]
MLAAAEPLRFDVRHVSPARRMLGKTRVGTVSFGEEGMSFRETEKSKKPLSLDVPYREMQQVTLGGNSVCIRLYRDRSVWKLGADEVYCFDRPKAGDFRALDGW